MTNATLSMPTSSQVNRSFINATHQIASRSVMLAEQEASIFDSNHMSVQNWFRPDNRLPKRIFGSIVDSLGPDKAAVTRLNYLEVTPRMYSTCRPTLDIVEHSVDTLSALHTLAAEIRGPVYASSGMMRAIQLAVVWVAVLVGTAGQLQAGIIGTGTLGLGTNDGTNVALNYLIRAEGSSSGLIAAYAGSLPPTGYFLADGATFDPVFYPELFGAIGSTTLPDLRDRTVTGTGTLGLGTDNGTSVALNYLIRAEGSSSGLIAAYAGSLPPTGYFLADGATFDPVFYPELFGAIGSTTLPDLRDRTVTGTGTLGLGTDNGTSVALNYLIRAEGSSSGLVAAYAGSLPPTGYFLADGATFDPVFYPELFGAIGSTTLPDLRDFTVTNSTVPEPSSLALFGIGACVMGLGAARRRRRKKQQEATT